jgi:hypothetical protein
MLIFAENKVTLKPSSKYKYLQIQYLENFNYLWGMVFFIYFTDY